MKDAILNEYNNKYPDEEITNLINENAQTKSSLGIPKKYMDPTLEKTLDTYFPKGDERRGDALILFSTAMVIINKLKRRLSEEE